MTAKRHHFWKSIQQWIVVTLVYLIIAQPIFSVMPQIAAAAEVEPNEELSVEINDQACLSYAEQVFDPAKPDYVLPDEPNGEPKAFSQIIDVTYLRQLDFTKEKLEAISSREYINRVLTHFGPVGMTYYKTPEITKDGTNQNKELVLVCDTAYQGIPDSVFNPFSPLDPSTFEVIDLIKDPLQKIAFVNPVDRYALMGERCAGGLIKKPLSEWDENDNPCPGFDPADDVFQNGSWDAPKVDRRVLETLLYLVTPIEQGGAGREYIRVKKLVQYDVTNPLTQPVVAATPDPSADPSAEAEEFDALLNQQFDEAAPVAEDEEATAFPSSYYINLNEPPHLPKTISSSVMIDQIDKLRVSTRVVQKRLFGNNTTEYKVQPPTPIDVSWQSDAGLQKDPPPDFSKLSMLESSRFLTNAAVIELLNQYGLGDLEIDVANTELNSLGDIGLVVGESLLEQLLGSPRGSLSGYNLLSTLKSIGLAYVEQNLGLVPGSLADVNPLDKVDETADFSQLTVSVGRATIEYVLGFPRGALRTESGTSNELLESVGRRYLEKQVFQVSDGTLLSSNDAPLKNVGDLLERLGEGRIEHVFKLPKQSLRKPTYDSAETNKSFRQSSFKATLLFPKLEGVTPDEKMFDMADYVSGKLSLAHIPYREVDETGKVVGDGSRNMYGFTEKDYEFPTLAIKTSDPDSLRKFKQLVGSSVIEGSLGIYRREGNSQNFLNGDNSLAPVKDLIIGGVTYNARYRPLSEVGNCDGRRCAGDDGRSTPISWCEGRALEYVTDGSLDRWVAKRGASDTVGTPDNAETAANIRQTISNLQDGWGSLNRTLARKGHSCEEDKSFEWSDPFLGQIRSIILNTTQVNQTIFLNQDKAPKLENFYNDGGTRGGEDSPQARYNTATLLFYNLPENHKEVSVNEIPTKSFVIGSEQTSDPLATSPKPKTVAEVLTILSDGGTGGASFTWNADSSLKKRLTMLENLLNKQVRDNTFDLASILSQNLPANQLDILLLDRLNLLTTRPVTNKNSANIAQFKNQYDDPAFNGWLYLIQDLRMRLDCKATNGFYTLKEDGTGMFCEDRPGLSDPGQDVLYEIEEAKRILDRLYKQPWALAQSIIKSLETRTYNDPSGFTNQSAQSAAIALSSVKFAIDENLRFKPETVYSKDIVRNLVAPNGKGIVPLSASIEPFFARDSSGKSLLGRSGIEYAAKKFSSDALGQATFAAQLKTDFGEIVRAQEDVIDVFDLAEKDADQYGFDYGSLVQKGLADDDFIRIFLLDQGNQVFERVGKEQALRTIWRKSGAAAKIKSAEQYQSILRVTRESIQQIEFYKDRLNRIKRLSDDLSREIERVGGNVDIFGKQLKKINAATDIARVDSIENARKLSKRYEPTLTQMTKTLRDTNRDVRDVTRIAYEINHLTQEIVAGRSLPRDEKFDSGYVGINQALEAGDPSRAKDGCYDKSTLLRSLTGGGDLGKRMFDFAVETGTCRLETGLGLPTQSVFMWYKLGSEQFPPTVRQSVLYPEINDPETGLPISQNIVVQEAGIASPAKENLFEKQPDGSLKALVPTWNKNRWSADNLALAVGIADQIQRDRDTIDPAQVNQWVAQQTAATITRLIKRGEDVLAATALAKLAQMIPGVGQLIKEYRLTTRDLAAIFQGNVQPLLEKIGGGFIDRAFDLPNGTGSELLFPECRTNDGKRSPCSKDPNNPQTDPDNVRVQIIAEVGLQKLGLTMPRIPRYFSFRAGGNLAENWGNASISDNLRLAPNSFRGKMVGATFQDTPFLEDCELKGIRCLNRSSNLARSFGFTTTPFARSLEQIKSRLSNQAGNLEFTDGGSIGELISGQATRILETYYAEATLGRASNGDAITNKTDYWTDLANAATAATNAGALSQKDLGVYKTTLDQLWDAVASSSIAPETTSVLRESILRLIPEEVGLSRNDLNNLLTSDYVANLSNINDVPIVVKNPSEYQDLYVTYIRVFQKRLAQLNATYSLSDNLFEKFVQGSIDASEITKKVGIAQTAGDILGTFLDKWIEDNGPSWMRELTAAFKLVTAEQCGGQEIGIGSFLAQTVSGTDGCLKNLGLFSTADLFYGTSENMKLLRRLLFEEFLGGIFSRELERQVGFRPGAFMRIVDSPRQARQILATEGVLMVADRVFGSQNKNQACATKTIPDANCTQSTIQSVLKDAFVAGFCTNPRKNDCDLTFSNERSLAAFNTAAGNATDQQLRRIGREYLGVEITRKDLAIHHGDMRGIALLGVQFVANTLNNSLYNGNPRSPMAKFFTTYYEDIRISMGYDEPQAWVLDSYKIDGGIREMYDYSCSGTRLQTNPACADNTITFDEYAQTIATEENLDLDTAKFVANGRMQIAGEEKAKNYASNRRVQSLQVIQYALLDVVAFSKDSSIPPNFTKRLLSGNGSERADALGEYLVGNIMKDSSALGKFVRTACAGQNTGTECFNLFKDLYDAFEGGQATMEAFFNSSNGNRFINLIDRGANQWFSQQFGIDLPDDTFKGIYVWGMRGFKGTDFNREGFCDGVSLAQKEASGQTCTNPIGIPIGRILQDFGEQSLTNWADKSFGFKNGTSAKIVKVAELIIERQNITKIALERGWSKAQITAAKTKNAVATAQLISEVVVSIFAQELTEFDRSIGLPPGTTSLIVGAAVTYGAAIAMGVSGSAATAAAFGPAFLIALGFQVVFGVTKVEITNLATSDGYYPFYSSVNELGTGRATRCIGRGASALGGCKAEEPYSQTTIHDPRTGEFDPTFTPVYRAGLKKASRAKVTGLLTDLLLMPGSDFVARSGLNPVDMRVSQLFTYGGVGAEYDPTTTKVVSQLINRNLPQDNEFPDFGYGSPELRCKNITDSEDGTSRLCERQPAWLTGFYGLPSLTGAIHVRW